MDHRARRAIGRRGRVPADLTPSRQQPSRGRGDENNHGRVKEANGRLDVWKWRTDG